MIELVALVLLILWFIFSYFIFNYICIGIKKIGWLRKNNKYTKSGVVFFIIFYLIPFWPHIFLHFYQVVTMPFVCDKLAGYHPYNPVKMTSIYDNSYAIKYLLLPNVDYTEWEISIDNKNEYTELFPVGKFQFSYFPDNTSECKYLAAVYPNISDHINIWRSSYSKWNFPIRDTSGMCLGVKKVEKITAKYKLENRLPNAILDSGFGYKVTNDYKQVVNKSTGLVVSRFQEISTSSPTPLGYWTTVGRSVLQKRCDAEYVKQFSDSDLSILSKQNITLIPDSVVLKYFFNFN
ncbi:MAG: hypothetical protein HOH19_13515 [Kordiimonadaceae bacterium]|jgi:hypothetical protein|nr:hypothetical protein [Kordiimonadaceae bacterium]MBT6033589.1 hypothetical protein [Kordiimonadaceae bacterium]